MVYVIKFNGDVRKNIAESASDDYEGLLHGTALEYLPGPDVTLLYCFNMDREGIRRLFSDGDWFWKNAIIPSWANEPLKGVLEQNYYYNGNNQGNPLKSQDKDCTLVAYQMTGGIKIFETLNSLLEFRDILRKFGGDEHQRRIKQFSIRIEHAMGSSPEDFDSIDELQENLRTRYKAKRLVPVSYTPWDSKEWNDEASRKIEDLDLLYLLECHTFETRTY